MAERPAMKKSQHGESQEGGSEGSGRRGRRCTTQRDAEGNYVRGSFTHSHRACIPRALFIVYGLSGETIPSIGLAYVDNYTPREARVIMRNPGLLRRVMFFPAFFDGRENECGAKSGGGQAGVGGQGVGCRRPVVANNRLTHCMES